jgi:hypothetical protein
MGTAFSAFSASDPKVPHRNTPCAMCRRSPDLEANDHIGYEAFHFPEIKRDHLTSKQKRCARRVAPKQQSAGSSRGGAQSAPPQPRKVRAGRELTQRHLVETVREVLCAARHIRDDLLRHGSSLLFEVCRRARTIGLGICEPGPVRAEVLGRDSEVALRGGLCLDGCGNGHLGLGQYLCSTT